MIYSHQLQLVFIHNPKCAGTTIRDRITKSLTGQTIELWGLAKTNELKSSAYEGIVDKAHLPINMLKKLYPEIFEYFHTSTVVAFTRHPITRLISAFNQAHNNFSKIQPENYNQELFNNYCVNVVNSKIYDARFIHARRQIDFISSNGKSFADCLIKIEEPAHGLQKLKVLNLPAHEMILKALSDKKNVRQSQRYIKLWQLAPTEIKEMIYIYYDNDFNFFNYKKNF